MRVLVCKTGSWTSRLPGPASWDCCGSAGALGQALAWLTGAMLMVGGPDPGTAGCSALGVPG